MVRVKRSKVSYRDVVMRPGQAAKDACDRCEEAKEHFSKAHRIRTWNWVFSQVSLGEVAVGSIQLERDRALSGTMHAAAGGALMQWVFARERRASRHIDQGVDAFNRCLVAWGQGGW